MWLIFHMYCNKWSSKISWNCETEQFIPWLYSPSQSSPVYIISKYHCRQCQRKHHTSLHSGEPSTTSSNINMQITIQNSPQVSAHILPESTHKPQIFATCLLKASFATISTENINTSANIIFDEGGQWSFKTT